VPDQFAGVRSGRGKFKNGLRIKAGQPEGSVSAGQSGALSARLQVCPLTAEQS